MMKHYNTSDKIQLLKDATNSKNQQHMDQLTSLIRVQNWNIMYRKSQEEYEFLTQMKTPANYYTLFIQHVDDSRQKTMTYEDTKQFKTSWTLEQNINLQQFILEVYMIRSQEKYTIPSRKFKCREIIPARRDRPPQR